ncbi:MAG: hypothetical protein ACJAQT_005212 [Akkermansiaceae bacterium]|jgi:hypothetical protein
MKFSIKTPEIYRKIILGEGALKTETIEAAIEDQIALALGRSPTPEELAKFTEFARREIEKTGRYFGLRNAMIAVMVSPTFIYRSELGLGEVQEDRRSMLSPAELAYAISYGLTDQKPDEALREAAKTGRLQTREDVIKKLLTTEEYFVQHSGDNEKERQATEASKKLYASFKDKNWKGYSKNAKT